MDRIKKLATHCVKKCAIKMKEKGELTNEERMQRSQGHGEMLAEVIMFLNEEENLQETSNE